MPVFSVIQKSPGLPATAKDGLHIQGKPAGTVMTVAFELDGQAFTALNGGTVVAFNSDFP